MRTQRRSPVTVQLVQVAVDRDKVGGYTENDTRTLVPGALFDAAQILERTDPSQAPVVEPAVFNVPGVFTLDADDLVEVVDVTGEEPVVLETWQVVGGSAVWLSRTKVPVTRAIGGDES